MKNLNPVYVFAAALAFAPRALAAPIYKVAVVQSSAQAIDYKSLKSSTRIDFKAADGLDGATGSAQVKLKAGSIQIDARFEGLPAPSKFGPEYLTYVLWAISPEGRPVNLGELVVGGGKSRLTVVQPLHTFGLVATAEPYFAVTAPSNVVVMENQLRKDTKGTLESIDAKYDLIQKGQYELNVAPDEFAGPMDPKMPLSIYEARNAVRIAKAAGAKAFAEEAFDRASDLLGQTERPDATDKQREAAARETVERAEDARYVAVQRQNAESLDDERRSSKEQIGMANGAAMIAELGQAEAEGETVKAQRDETGTRAQLVRRLNAVLPTRDGARGPTVSVAGVAFADGDAVLPPEAREKLAKISGLLEEFPDLKLAVEDRAGADAGPQDRALFEKRAQSARDYLASQGVTIRL